jgi:hypothetical protein
MVRILQPGDEALGFRRIGDYRFTLLKEPVAPKF